MPRGVEIIKLRPLHVKWLTDWVNHHLAVTTYIPTSDHISSAVQRKGATKNAGELAFAQVKAEGEPSTKETQKELIKALYSNVASGLQVVPMEVKPVQEEIFMEMRRVLYAFHVNIFVDQTVHVPQWRSSLEEDQQR